MLKNRFTLVLTFVAIFGQTLHAQPTPAQNRNNELLPKGAFQRLGDLRFRVPGLVEGIRFVEGGKKLLVRVPASISTGYIPDQRQFHVFDAQKGLEMGRLAFDYGVSFGYWTGSNGPLKDSLRFASWCISPDGKLLASLKNWPMDWLQVCELQTGKVVFEIKADKLAFSFVQFSPDSKRVAAVVVDHDVDAKKKLQPFVAIRMWDLRGLKEIRTFVPPLRLTETFQAHWFTFSPDGAFLAATGYEEKKAGIVRVWDVAGNGPSRLLEGQTAKRNLARAIAFSPDSKSLAAAHDGKIRLWDAATGKRVKDVAEFTPRCAAIDFSPDGKRLIAAAGKEGANAEQVRMWDLPSGREIALPTGASQGYAFSANGDTLALAFAVSGDIVICDAATGQARKHIAADLPPRHGGHLESAFYLTRQGMGWPFALTPDGKMLVCGVEAGQLRRFDVASGKEIPAPGVATDPAPALAYSPDGKKLIAAGFGRVLLHDLNGKMPPLELRATFPPDPTKPNTKRANPVTLAYTSDGRRAAAGWTNGFVTVWDTATGKTLWQTEAHKSTVQSLAFGPNDQFLISTGQVDGRIIWWNALTGRQEKRLEKDTDIDLNARFSPSEFVLGHAGLTAFLSTETGWQEWELTTTRMRRELKTKADPVAMSSDGRFTLVRGNSAFHLIDLASGAQLRSFAYDSSRREDYSSLNIVRFSPDGQLIAALAGRDAVRVWERDTGTLLSTFKGHNGGAQSIAFAPDGKSFATSSGDGTILFWRTPDRPPAFAKAELPPAPKKIAAGRDSDGEPLPSAAKARLGLLRFQNGLPITGLRYSSDGKSILAQTSSPDGSRMVWTDLALWDATTGRLQNQIEVTYEDKSEFGGHRRAEYWSISPDSRFLATANTPLGRAQTGTIPPMRIREIGSGKIVFQGKEPEKFDGNVRFAPDGKTLLDVANLNLIDLSNGRESKLDGMKRLLPPTDAEFSPDGKTVLIVNWDNTVDFVNMIGGAKGVRLPATIEFFIRPVFSPNSKQLAIVTVSTDEEKSRLILIEIGSGTKLRDFGEVPQAPERVLFSPDGSQLVAVFPQHDTRDEIINGRKTRVIGQHAAIKRWELAGGTELPVLEIAADYADVQFTPDGKHLAIGAGRFLRLLDAISGREVRRFPLEIIESSTQFPLRRLFGIWSRRYSINDHGTGDPFAFSPDGKTVAVAAGRTIRQFHLASGKEIGPTPNSQTFNGLAVSNNGQWIASASIGLVQVWDVRQQKVAFQIESWLSADMQLSYLTAMAMSGDGRRVAVGGSDGEIALFDVPSGKRIKKLRFHTAPITSLVFLDDDATLASADRNAQIAYWDAGTASFLRGQAVPGLSDSKTRWRAIEQGDGTLYLKNTNGERAYSWTAPIFTPNGSLIILEEKTIKLLDLAALSAHHIVDDDRHSYGRLASSKDGRLLALLSPRYYSYGESLIRLMDVSSGKQVRGLATTLAANDCAFSPDGQWLAACGDKGLCIWDTATGTHHANFNGHRGEVLTVAFSADGGTLVSASADGTLLVWDVAALIGKPAKTDIAAGELKALWTDLSSTDAVLAGNAMRRLASHPEQAAKLLRENLKPIPVPTADIAQLVADLDDANPKVRAKANKALEDLAEFAEPALQACLAGNPTLEQRLRAERLFARLSDPLTDSEKLRALRAVELLEMIGTPEAIEVLRLLAGGADAAHVTRQAHSALWRSGLGGN